MGRAPSIITLMLSLGVIADVFASPYDREIATAARRAGLSPHLVHAVVKTESAYRTSALSPAGAVGLMQLMPATAKRFGVTNRKDPAQSLRGGTTYLAWLLKRYKGNLQLALAGYNAGEGAVDKYNGIPPYRETRNYVVKVMRELRRRQAVYPGNASNPNLVRIAKKQEAQPSKQTSIEALDAASMVRVTSLQKGMKSPEGPHAKQELGVEQDGTEKNSTVADAYTVRYANLAATQTRITPVGFSFFGVN